VLVTLWNACDDDGIDLFLKIKIRMSLNESAFISFQGCSYFTIIQSYNPLVFLNRLARLPVPLPISSIVLQLFPDKGIVEVTLHHNQQRLIHGVIYCRHFFRHKELPYVSDLKYGFNRSVIMC
jgi:hypothetical protein